MARTRSSKAAPAAVWSASEVRSRPVASLAPYAANARVHAEAQVAQIAASIQEFGFVNPVIVDENGEIIAGHGRVLAAQRLGLIEVPTIERAGLSDAQKRGLRLADNKIALNSGWDEKLLAEELSALSEMDGFDVEITGFDGARDQSTLWTIRNAAGEDDATVHSTQKPVECMRRPIVNSSVRGDAVYEPFSGSGSTIIACETAARRCYAMELNPAYVDVAVVRWQVYTGRVATLEGGGRFDEEAAARGAPAAA